MTSKAEKRFIELTAKGIKTKAEIDEMEEARIIFERELDTDEQNLKKEMQLAGVNVSSVWDLVNTKKSYPEVIDILIKHLAIPYHHRTKEGIVRALIVKEAKGKAVKPLLDLYERLPFKVNNSLRWAITFAICSLITRKDDVERIKRVAIAEEDEPCKEQLKKALKKVKIEI